MNKYSSHTSFIDLLFNLLLVFVSLFVLSFLLISPKEQDKKIDPDGEFMIVLSWDGDSRDDIDLWVRDPAKNLVNFQRREAGLMHLDRDDMGELNDMMDTELGTIEINKNQELVMLRGYSPGEYIVNTHAYAKRDEPPVEVDVEVIKINPFGTVYEGKHVFSKTNEERTMCRFYLDEDGRVIKTSNLQMKLTRMRSYR